MTRHLTKTLLPCLAMLLLVSVTFAQPRIPVDLLGDWSLALESNEPAWMSVVEEKGRPIVYLRIHVGPVGPYDVAETVGDRIRFSLKPLRKAKGSDVSIAQDVEVGITDGKLDGVIVRTPGDGTTGETVRFTGKRIPPMPASPPDLSKVRFGEKIVLFNGRDLTGWRPHEPDKINGWSVQDGVLVNTTPKTDFSATGAYANLRTDAEFEDFRLHIEFLVEENRNSGVYLRGMYEAQVVDRDSRMQGLQGVGAIFGRIAPSKNAGKPGGQWQTYDLTLVDRHVTVVLNGETVIDNQPVVGPTGGAVFTDPSAPGPIHLQGDHTNVKYRNIVLEPVVRRSTANVPVRHLYVAKLLLRRLESADLTSEQMTAFNHLSRDLRTRIDRMRQAVGITQEIIKRRDEVYSQLKQTDLEGDALWEALKEESGTDVRSTRRVP